MGAASPPSTRVDFVIFTALNEECEAVKDIFGLKGPLRESTGEQTVEYYHGFLDGCLVACVRCTDRGNLPSANLARAVISLWRPRFLIVVGIGGGVIGRDGLRVGDVVFSSSVEYYQYAKETQEIRGTAGTKSP